MRRVLPSIIAIALASAGVVVACRNEVPRPVLPVQPRELTGHSPKPPQIDPSKDRSKRDQKHQPKPKRVGEAPGDAGADSLTLPPLDGKVPLLRDAAQPL